MTPSLLAGNPVVGDSPENQLAFLAVKTRRTPPTRHHQIDRAVPPEALEDLADLALVQLVVDRDIAAFEVLVNRYRPLLSRICSNLTACQADAEDALQLVLLAVWQRVDTYRGTAKFSTWLYRVATNETRGQTRRRTPEPTADIPDIPAAMNVAQRVTDVDAVRNALACLPDDQRVTLILRECHDLPLDEIADILIVAVGTVKSRLTRAREAMAVLLKDRDL